MENLAKMILTATLIIATCSLFANNGDFRKKDDGGNQYSCPQQHRDGGDGNQQYKGEQYTGEQYPGEEYQDKFDKSNNQNQQQCYKKSNCKQMQGHRKGKGYGMKKRNGKGPHHNKQINTSTNQEAAQNEQQKSAPQGEQIQN